MIENRYYQSDALAAIKDHIHMPGNDLVVLPTGAGKSIVIAQMAKDLNTDVLILQPSKEILEQNIEKLAMWVDKDDIGVYSASMKSKTIRRYTFATIGSVHKKVDFFSHFKIVIIDECHKVNPKDMGSMFSSFLKKIGNPKVIGFTATPYRNMQGYHKLDNGMLEVLVTNKLICRIKPEFWKRIIYNVDNAELVAAGYLSPLKYIDASIVSHETIPLNKSKSDFDIEAYDRIAESKHDRFMKGITWAEQNHKHVLVFCSSVGHAVRLQGLVPGAKVISAKTDAKERERIIQGFKKGVIQTVFNVGVLTTGFDHPALDCIMLNRPTRSLALYYQMPGRGVRICPGKTHCTVIDFTGTVKGLGRIETIKLKKNKLWELTTETGDWHNRALYSYVIDKNFKTV